MLLAALAASACSGGSQGTSRPTTPSSNAPCAWPSRADKATQNVAYPDTASTYWSTSYHLAPGEHLELRAKFPTARYFSFITYGIAGGVIDRLTDRDIQPDAGGSNPYRGSAQTAGSYTIEIRDRAGTDQNAVSAATGQTGSTTPTSLPSTVNTFAPLGTGAPGASGVVAGTVIYRVYLPKTRDDPTGGAGLPSIDDVRADGTRTTIPSCAHAGANPAATTIVNANGPATDTPAPPQPVFVRPKKNATNLYPDPDNIYLATIVHHTPGRVVIVRGKAPTFPDTGAGAPITAREQVRYWSLCTNEYRKPYPVSFCVPDQDVALDASGDYTIVISTPQDRPTDATTEHGITWLNWGSTSVDALLLVRQMLPRAGDPYAASNVTPGELASSTMGPYAPVGSYCTTASIAQRGYENCSGS